MNAQHMQIRAHKRVKRLVRKLKSIPKDNVFRYRIYERIDELTAQNRAAEYLTVLGA